MEKGNRLETLVENIIAASESRREIGRVEVIKEKQGKYATFPEGIGERLVSALKKQGIEKLYSHQREAIEEVFAGKNVVIATPTASGKSLCYNLPVLSRILEDKNACALYLFPTKALSQDQMIELNQLIEALSLPIACYTYDGDTPADARKAIRRKGNLVITNPDMLHTGILPHHTRWLKLFTNLRFVVIDELHSYRGVFGSHFANLMRRFLRVAQFYGVKPGFICSSATIGNPKELAEQLIGEPFTLIDKNGSPSGKKYFLFVNPPLVNPALGIRASYINEARKYSGKFISNGVKTIVFAPSRLKVEVLTRYLKDDFRDKLGDERIRGYRGGYLPGIRREIEKGLKEGEVAAVVSTNALELGIDIGELAASIIAGYPGTIASTWQEAGRAGRKRDTSAAVLVARSNPLDQFIINHPDYFFAGDPEEGRVNPENPVILASHIKCAAFELPIAEGEDLGGKIGREIVEILTEDGLLHKTKGKWHWASESYPADSVSLRAASTDNFVVIERGEKDRAIGEVDYDSAFTTLYPSAIYLAEGECYQVSELDFAGRRAYVTRVSTDYYTEAISYTGVTVLDIFEGKEEGGIRVEQGEVRVNTRVAGYKKIKFETMENLGYGEVNLPEQELVTEGYWFTIPEGILSPLPFAKSELVDGLLGISYLLIHLSSFLLMCDVSDFGRSIGDRDAGWFAASGEDGRGFYNYARGMSPLSPGTIDRFCPTIFIYENYPGGVGGMPLLYEKHSLLLSGAANTITSCPCRAGCPSCIGPSAGISTRAKEVALRILKEITADV
jgi:DEAD/DEAH box helicase domain-containing protein